MFCKSFFVLFFAFASVCTVKCEGSFRYDRRCYSLCQTFVPFIQVVIEKKSFVAGTMAMSVLQNMVNERATKFCLSRVDDIDKVFMFTFLISVASILLPMKRDLGQN